MDPCPDRFRWSQLQARQELLGNNSIPFFMKILCWNSQGAARPQFREDIMDIVRLHDPMLIFITETRVPTDRADSIWEDLKFDSATGIDAIGLSGGIWVLWDSARIYVEIPPHGQQALHLLVKVISIPKFSKFTWLL